MRRALVILLSLWGAGASAQDAEIFQQCMRDEKLEHLSPCFYRVADACHAQTQTPAATDAFCDGRETRFWDALIVTLDEELELSLGGEALTAYRRDKALWASLDCAFPFQHLQGEGAGGARCALEKAQTRAAHLGKWVTYARRCAFVGQPNCETYAGQAGTNE
ncbi:MAG: hypothetical protein AAF401_14470 [Pseudomonadota bacterium]